MKIKIALPRNEYKTLYNCFVLLMPLIRNISDNNADSILHAQATKETMTGMFLKMTKKMIDLKQKNTLSMSVTEAYFFDVVFRSGLPKTLGIFEKTIILDILAIINQKTLQ